MKVSNDTILDLSRAIDALIEKRNYQQGIVRKLQCDLTEIKNRLRNNGMLPPKEYNSLCNKQNIIVASISSTLDKINDIKLEISKKHTLKQALKDEMLTDEDKEIIQKLEILKSHYVNFAADRSRISSMRAMAAEFAEKINMIIKPL